MNRLTFSWIVLGSLLFYAWWNPAYIFLILGSIVFNYIIGKVLLRSSSKPLIYFGIAINIFILAYFKYTIFFVENINIFLETSFSIKNITLPLGISFFTFQQITFLISAFKKEINELNFIDYMLFVAFFPQLIAGPIVHHKEMLPQFRNKIFLKPKVENLSIGFSIFTIGLFKKIVLADGIAPYASPIFDAAETDITLTIFESWFGAIAFTLQLYFDFSGYSDMAIGLSRMFGIILPLNFNSPYKSTNIIDFWRRWHITLSRFLRDYLYIPLGGSRHGEKKRVVNLMVTMLVGGLWHGAGWTYIIWGGMHGLYLVVNHSWKKIFPSNNIGYFRNIFSWAVTMLAVIVAWVPFRSHSLQGANNILRSMFGLNGLSFPKSLMNSEYIQFPELWTTYLGISFNGMFLNEILVSKKVGFAYIIVLTTIALFFPNTQQWMNKFKPAFETYNGEIRTLTLHWMHWRPSKCWAAIIAIIFVVSTLNLTRISEFLYFQF
jgi:alginate O-acetyltransferase complex protein AlgI